VGDLVTAGLDKTEILSVSFALAFTDTVFKASELRGCVQGGEGLPQQWVKNKTGIA